MFVAGFAGCIHLLTSLLTYLDPYVWNVLVVGCTNWFLNSNHSFRVLILSLSGYHFASCRDQDIFCKHSLSASYSLFSIAVQAQLFVAFVGSASKTTRWCSIKALPMYHCIDDIDYKNLCGASLLTISLSTYISPDTPIVSPPVVEIMKSPKGCDNLHTGTRSPL